MDGTQFDHIARLLTSRRKALSALLGGGLVTSLSQAFATPEAAAARKRKQCPRGKKRCGKRCILKRKCCTNANCRSAGRGKVCLKGTCQCPGRGRACGGACCPAGARCIGGTCWPDAEERAFVALINQHRAANGRSALSLQNQLGTAAEVHSQDQASNQFSSHTGSDGSTPPERITRAGYSLSFWGENIYYGGSTAAAAFAWWRQSPGHDANMLYQEFTELGIGRAQSSAGVWYWTTTFGRPS